MTKWEYLYVIVSALSDEIRAQGDLFPNTDAMLKAFGLQGWELVSVVPIVTHDSDTDQLEYYFKRPISN